MTQLFAEDTVYISEQQDQKSVFKEIAQKLFEKGLVTEEYLDNLIDREENYPTALPLSPIDSSLPNIAIPHTESQFVNVTRIVPVKLEHAITFHNMILPDEKLEVSFLFMILNNEEKEQAGLLAAIMDFINRQDKEALIKFFNEEFLMIKILAACGAGVNSSHQIKNALETELTKRGYQVSCDAVMIKDINEELLSHYDIFAQISKTDLGFDVKLPVVDAGAILYRIPAMAEPVYKKMEDVINSLNK